uniref:Organic cation/carnitine transporter 3-like n=1 Tax=Rhizophora mucronata TaxID=61149 RepID=A0A2P2IUZ5_RHIMU
MGSVLGLFILASLADSSLGRKKLLFLSCLLMSVASFSTVFSTNIWLYSALKFVCGIGRASVGTCSLVLLTEMVGRQWRGSVSIMGFLFFTLGYLSLPSMAYTLRGSSWKSMYSWTSLPVILYCALFPFLVNESPRWLFTQGRHEEAVEVLNRIGLVKDYGRLRENGKDNSKQATNNNNRSSNKFYSSLKKLFERKWAVKRVLLAMVLGFGIGMVYFGMPLGVGKLGFNVYLGVMFNALLEIPSYAVTIVLLEKCNRRASLLGFCTLSGALSILICVASGDGDGNNSNDYIHGWKNGVGIPFLKKIWLEIASLFSGVTAFNVLLAYAIELFPTCVRNSATSMVSQALNLGAVFSPLLVSAGSHVNLSFLSFGVFGLVIICCGLFVVCLPETKGALLCDTMDEQEQHELATSEFENP